VTQSGSRTSDDEINLMALMPEEAVIEIGRIILCWSQAEGVFDSIYTHLVIRDNQFELDDPRLSQLAQPFMRRVREVRMILRKINPMNLSDWERTLSQTERLRRKRDVIAHGQFAAIPEEGTTEFKIDQSRVGLSYKSYRNQRPHDFGPILISSLSTTRAQIGRLWFDLMDLLLT
jgi:hypothetical protein